MLHVLGNTMHMYHKYPATDHLHVTPLVYFEVHQGREQDFDTTDSVKLITQRISGPV